MNKNVQKFAREIPALSESSEGKLRGGFTAISVMSSASSDTNWIACRSNDCPNSGNCVSGCACPPPTPTPPPTVPTNATATGVAGVAAMFGLGSSSLF